MHSNSVGFLKSIRNIRALTTSPVKFFEQLITANEGRPVVPFINLAGRKAYLITNGEMNDAVLTSKQFGLAELLMSVLAKQFGREGHFTSDGETWECVKSTLSPLFARDEVLIGQKRVLLEREISAMVHKIKAMQGTNQPLDILGLAQQTTMSIALKIIIGADLTATQIDQSRHDLEGMVRSTFERMSNPLLFFSPLHFWRTRAMVQRQHTLVKRLMHDRPPEKGFITALQLLSQGRERGTVSNEMFFSSIIQLLVAGHETTATALTWLCFHLSLNNNLCHDPQLRREAEEVMRTDSTTTALNFGSYPALINVITNVLMGYSPIISVFRSPTSDQTISHDGVDYRFEKGSLLYLPLLLLNQKQKEESGVPNSPFKTRAFGRGRRMCPGAPLAIQTLVLFLAKILTYNINFSSSPCQYTAHLAYKPSGLTLNVS